MRRWFARILDCFALGVFTIVGVFISIFMVGAILCDDRMMMIQDEGLPTGMLMVGATLLVVAATVLALLSFSGAIRDARRILRTHLGLCPMCKYDLRGDLDAGCPECRWNRAERET